MSSFNAPPVGSAFLLRGQHPLVEGSSLQVRGVSAVVGRGQDCQAQINVASVSRHHARFTFIQGKWYIEDLGSSSGTFLNGTPVKGQVPVPAGSIIMFGSIAFQFETHSRAQAQIATPPPSISPPPPPSSRRASPRSRRWIWGCLGIVAALAAGGCGIVYGLPLLASYVGPEYAKYTDIPQLVTDWWNASPATNVTPPEVEPIVTLEPTGLTVAETGFTVSAGDGATVEFPPFYGEPDASVATLTKITEPSGETTEYGSVVSGLYELNVPAPDDIYSSLTAALPVEPGLMQGMDISSLQPFALDQLKGEWIAVGTVIEYDETTETLHFDLPFSANTAQAESSAGHLGARVFRSVGQTQQQKTQLRIEGSWFSSWVTTQSPDSKFQITYYPLKNHSAEVKNDEWWNSQTGNATNSDIPDYIEDLDAALNQAYDHLLKIPKLGGMLFNPLSEPIEVTVKNTGTAEGSVFLPTGSMSITNYKLKNFNEMRKVAGHELTHLLQDQHYNTYNAANNKWFFEATAEHFSMRANAFSEPQRGRYYEEGGTDYLRVPLTTSSEKNMYFVGHFLDWISKTYGETVVPSAIEVGGYGTIIRDDLQYLERAINTHGFTISIEDAYTAFGRYLAGNPAGYGGINGELKGHMQNIAQTHISSNLPVFTDQVTYIQFSQKAPQLTMASILLAAKNTRSAALVIDPSGSSGGNLTTFTYAFPSRANRDYTQSALDVSLAFPYAAPLVVSDFYATGQNTILEQTFTNAHRSEGGNIIVAYYLLTAPQIISVDDGQVAWSNAEIGNLPRAYLKGYNIYRNGVRLNSSPIPDPGAGVTPLFSDDRIKASDPIVVSIIDKYGNMWPEVVEVAAPPTPTPTPTPTVTPTPGGSQTPDAVTETPGPSSEDTYGYVARLYNGTFSFLNEYGEQSTILDSVDFGWPFVEHLVSAGANQTVYTGHKIEYVPRDSCVCNEGCNLTPRNYEIVTDATLSLTMNGSQISQISVEKSRRETDPVDPRNYKLFEATMSGLPMQYDGPVSPLYTWEQSSAYVTGTSACSYVTTRFEHQFVVCPEEKNDDGEYIYVEKVLTERQTLVGCADDSILDVFVLKSLVK
jgi:hypothetical protein